MATISDAYKMFAEHFLVEDGGEPECAICGERLNVGQWCIEVPAGLGPPNAIVTVHLGCAINDGEVDPRAVTSEGE